MIRVGHGYDVHAFGRGKHIVLAGVRIKHSKKLKAHSDGDVLIHALCDALLGSLALGDIGHHFPDTDAQYKDADSRELLRHVRQLVVEQYYRINNVDITVLAEKPKLAPHIIAMRENLAADLEIAVDQVSVKATTTEKLGFVGREEGIAVHASVLIEGV